MIVRMWHGRVPTSKARAYREFTNGRAIPDYRSVPGNLSVHVLERREGDVTHFVTLTFWESLDAIKGFAGDDVEVAKYYPEDKDFLLEFEPTVVHYEVVGHSQTADLAPLETLYDASQGDPLPLPAELAALYGSLRFRLRPDRPTLISNFVSTLDGVVSLNAPGHAGGDDISGFDERDRMVMGLLRAVADVVVVGTGGLRIGPDHMWTADYIYPPLAGAYRSLRDSLGKGGPPLHVIVTASGEVDTGLRVFVSGEVPVLVVTTADGARRMGARGVPPAVQIVASQSSGLLSAQAILDAVGQAHPARPGDIVLVEGGPRLVGVFFAGRRLDELFLTLAPQIAGRDGSAERPGFVGGQRFAPEHPLWGALVGVKRGGSHLFLRYAFE